MKKLLGVTILLIFLVPSVVIAEEIDGYFWETLPGELKSAYIRGFIVGYNAGFSQGVLKGSIEYMSNLDKKSKEVLNLAYKTPQACIEFYEERMKQIKKDLAKGFLGSPADINRITETVKFYINEVDSFYKTYPLCRRENLDIMFGKIVLIWDKKGIFGGVPYSYKELGEKCLQFNK
ncbi:MAG: hypothetical protein L6246_02550 [Thermodesulfovibrionales bacterium]|nr:hypothetical protein [Nitrospinota bacterium]MCG2709188.1 hypothetical protein [Thermodesulfovibrionales bacterium]